MEDYFPSFGRDPALCNGRTVVCAIELLSYWRCCKLWRTYLNCTSGKNANTRADTYPHQRFTTQLGVVRNAQPKDRKRASFKILEVFDVVLIVIQARRKAWAPFIVIFVFSEYCGECRWGRHLQNFRSTLSVRGG